MKVRRKTRYSVLGTCFLALALSAVAQNTATVTATARDFIGGAASSYMKFRFELVNCGGSPPRVPNGVLAPDKLRMDFNVDSSGRLVDAAGDVGAALYKNGVINCGGAFGSHWRVSALNRSLVVWGPYDYDFESNVDLTDADTALPGSVFYPVSWRGAWASGTTYRAYDVVSYMGSTYMALVSTTGVLPGSDDTRWALVAQKGDTGSGGGGGGAGFNQLTGGTNSSAAMYVGSGAALGRSGSGTIDANLVNSATVPASAQLLGSNSSRQLVAATYPTPGPSSLGMVNSADCSATGHLQKINTDGSITCSVDGGDHFGVESSNVVFLFGAATGNLIDVFAVADTLNNTGTGHLFKARTASGSALKPFTASANGNGVEMSTAGVLAPIGTGTIVASSLNGKGFDAPGPIGYATPAAGFFTTLTLSSCGSGTYVKADGSGCDTPSSSGGGLGDPGSNGIIKRTALNTTAVSAVADVIGLWTGSCGSTTYLRADGSCQTPTGAGNVSNVGTPSNGQFGQWTGPTTMQGFSFPTSAALLGTNSSNTPIALTVLPTAAEPARTTGDVRNSAGSLAMTAVALNGGTIPVSAAVVGTNSSGQLAAQNAAGVVGLFSGCSGTLYLGADGACHSGTGTGLGDPGANGIVKRTSLDTTTTAAVADIVGLFSSCSGTQYLGYDGNCHTMSLTSVFGRTGTVTAQSGDYTASQVGLGNVTNDAQTKAAVLSNTVIANTVPVGNIAGTAYGPQTLPSCPDSGGNHLNYNNSTLAFTCGTTGGTAGSAAFNTLTGGTNTQAAMVIGSGASLGTTGTGTIAATSLSANIAESQVTNLTTDLGNKEPALGNPSVTGYVLSSTTAGVRSWIAAGGSMTYPGAGIPNSTGSAWGTSFGASGNGSKVLTTNLATDPGAGTPLCTDGSKNATTSGCPTGATVGYLAITYNGTPPASTYLVNLSFPYAFTIPINCTGSVLFAGTGPSGAATYTLYKNGVSFGTAYFSSGATTATWTCASSTTFTANSGNTPGDVLTVIGGGVPQIANLGGGIYGTH